MLTKTLLCICFLTTLVDCASLQRNIPVEVRYEEISGKELKQPENVQKAEDLQVVGCGREEILNKINGQKEEQPSSEPAVISTQKNIAEEDQSSTASNVKSEERDAEVIPSSNLEEKPQLSNEQQKDALKHLPEPKEETITAKRIGGGEGSLAEFQSMLEEAQHLVSNGLQRIKSSKPNKDQVVLNPQQWLELEKAVDRYFDEEKTKLSVKQSAEGANQTTSTQNQNFFQNLANGFQTLAANFVQNLQQGQGNSSRPAADEPQGGSQGGSGGGQGGFQGFVSFFQGGINNIANSISNLGGQGGTTSNTVLGDTGSTTQSSGLFSNFINTVQGGVQQFWGQVQGAAPNGTQGDTGSNATTGAQGPAQAIQSGFQQIGSAINNFIQSNRPPGSSGDENPAGNNTNIIQSIGQNIGNAFQQFIPFRPGQGGQGGQGGQPALPISGGQPNLPIAGGQTPAGGIQEGIQNVGNQIQQLVPGQQQSSSTESVKKPEDEAQVPQIAQTEDNKQQTENSKPEEASTEKRA